MSSRPTVYLAGPITGLSYDGALGWRQHVAKTLSSYGIEPWNPMRHKEYLKGSFEFTPESIHEGTINKMSLPAAITTRDRWDVKTKDLIFVNVLGADRVSIGTVMEIGWAQAYDKLIVLVIENKGNSHQHAMLLEACKAFRFDDLDEAMDATRRILISQ